MLKLFLVMLVSSALAVGGFWLMTRDRATESAIPVPARPASAEAGKTGFVGNSGYLLTLPPGYEVYPEMRGKAEVVLFYPKGTALTADEKQFKALGIVRLEVSEKPKGESGGATLEQLKGGVEFTLKQNKETYTIKPVSFGKAAFQADITQPSPLTQVFIEGGGVFYVFTAGDEELIYSLARTLQETGK